MKKTKNAQQRQANSQLNYLNRFFSSPHFVVDLLALLLQSK